MERVEGGFIVSCCRAEACFVMRMRMGCGCGFNPCLQIMFLTPLSCCYTHHSLYTANNIVVVAAIFKGFMCQKLSLCNKKFGPILYYFCEG